MNRSDIKSLVIGIIEEYKTNNPFELTDILEIPVLYHDLPSETEAYRLGNILVVNINSPREKQRWLLAHELGHYFIHGPEYTLNKFINNNLLVKGKIEREADIFASELLLADINAYMIEGLTCKQLSSLFCVPEKYIKYKLVR